MSDFADTLPKGTPSPIVWVFLCAVCAGFAPITARHYHGRLSGICQGCGNIMRERHRFSAYIDSASGCTCGTHGVPVTGDLAADFEATDDERGTR